MLRLKALACKVMTREMNLLAGQSENLIHIQWLKQALHLEPEQLRRAVQEYIDDTDRSLADEPYDAILLGYGLCSNGMAGIQARSVPLVVPRAHDCITLLLGSKERYQDLFQEKSGGIYWYSTGWWENALLPSKDRYQRLYREYVEKYGEDNADYLMEMEQTWMKEYDQAIYIHWPQLHDADYALRTRESADFLNWQFRQVEGSPSLLQRLFQGDWDDRDFLVVPPGRKIRPTYDDKIIGLE